MAFGRFFHFLHANFCFFVDSGIVLTRVLPRTGIANPASLSRSLDSSHCKEERHVHLKIAPSLFNVRYISIKKVEFIDSSDLDRRFFEIEMDTAEEEFGDSLCVKFTALISDYFHESVDVSITCYLNMHRASM